MRLARPAAAAALLAAAVALAAEPVVPPAAVPQKEEYDLQVLDAQNDALEAVDAARTVYLAKLDGFIKTATDGGDLDKVLALKAEREWAAKGDPTAKAPPAPPAARTARSEFEAKAKAAKVAYDKRAKVALAVFVSQLGDVVKEETKGGRVESAVAVRTAAKEFEKAGPPALVVTVSSPGTTAKVEPKVEPKPIPKTEPKTVVKTPPPPPGKFDWVKAVATPARIKVADIEPVPLAGGGPASKGGVRMFPEVPKRFDADGVMVFAKLKKPGDTATNGLAEITVEADGYLFLACHFGNQGGGGAWEAERWMAKQFIQNGWLPLAEPELGGKLVRSRGETALREQVVFVKFVRKGEEMRLRCNKYEPPFAIVFGGEKK